MNSSINSDYFFMHEEKVCRPSAKKRWPKSCQLLTTLCCMLALFFSTTMNAQIPTQCGSPGCNSNDVRITKAKISDEFGNFFVCAGVTPVSGAWLHLFVTTNTKRVGVFVSLTINVVVGTDTSHFPFQYCFTGASLNGVDNDLKTQLPDGTFTCGGEVFLTSIFTAWGTGGGDFCGGSTGVVCQSTPSKCRFVPGEVIKVQTNPCDVPSSVLVTPSSDTKCVGSNSSFTVGFGNNQSATIQWEVSTNGGTSWSPLAGQTAATLNLTGVTALMNGNLYHAIVTNHTSDQLGTHDCPATSTSATLTVKTPPTTSSAGSAQSICSTGSAVLAANSPSSGTGAWSVVSGPSTLASQFSSTSSNTATFTPAGGAGSYILRWTISNSPCTASASDVTITVIAPPTVSNAGSTQTICSTGSATLTANSPSPGTGVWSVVSGPSTASSQFSNTSSNTATFTPAGGAGSYNLRWTISNSPCTASTSDVTISVTAPPTTATAGITQNLCGTLTSTSLGGNTPGVGTGAWSKNSGPGTVSFSAGNSGSSTATASVVGAYVFTWTISNGVCPSSSANITVNLFANPGTPTADVVQPTCSVPTGTITVTSGTAGLSFSINSTNPADFTNTSGVFSGLSAGGYIIRAKNVNGCISAGLSKTINAAASAPPAPGATIVSNVSCSSSTGTVKIVTAAGGADYDNTVYEFSNDGTNWGTSPSFTFTAGQGYNLRVRRIADHTCVLSVICAGEAGRAVTTSDETVSRSVIQSYQPGESTIGVKAYPNPYNDKVRFVINSPEAGNGSLEVVNILGQKVKTIFQGHVVAGSQSFEMSVSPQQRSTLIYIFKVNDKQVTGKLLQLTQ